MVKIKNHESGHLALLDVFLRVGQRVEEVVDEKTQIAGKLVGDIHSERRKRDSAEAARNAISESARGEAGEKRREEDQNFQRAVEQLQKLEPRAPKTRKQCRNGYKNLFIN